jgi:hypothetical protein
MRLNAPRFARIAIVVGAIFLMCQLALVQCAAGATMRSDGSTAASIRTLTCTDNDGASSTIPSDALRLNGIAFLGTSPNSSNPVEHLANGHYWSKSFISIVPTDQTRHLHSDALIEISTISGSRIGLDWGTQSSSDATHVYSSSPSSVLRVRELRLDRCGTDEGFPGGFLLSGSSACVRLTIQNGSGSSKSREITFGTGVCPT